MKYMSMPSIVAKAIMCLLLSTAGITLSHGQTNDSIAHTMLVADYDYTCQTSNAKGEELKVSYGLTLQVAQDMACTMGRKRHSGENDMSERLLYAPVTWQNYPQGKMTSLEAIPPYQYLTSEAMPQLKWKVQAEHDTICGLPCQKAIGQYGGRTWTAWFAEGLPSRFGPWRLGGLPGLILRAVSEDGIHHFECNRVDFVKEAIAYSVPNEAVKCTRAKFVKLRNSTFGNPNYLTNPDVLHQARADREYDRHGRERTDRHGTHQYEASEVPAPRSLMPYGEVRTPHIPLVTKSHTCPSTRLQDQCDRAGALWHQACGGGHRSPPASIR